MAHMDVLLCEDVDNLGQRGQVVKVRAGYGRNYLLPQGLAIAASAGNRKMIDEQRRVLAKREARERGAAQSESSRLEGLQLRFDRKVGDHGILFGSVTALDITEALKAQGVEVERRRVILKEPIKEVGDYTVTIKLHRDVTPSVTVKVRKEGAPDDEAAASETAETAETAPGASPAEDAAPTATTETAAATADAAEDAAAEAEESAATDEAAATEEA